MSRKTDTVVARTILGLNRISRARCLRQQLGHLGSLRAGVEEPSTASKADVRP
jgi:hypothetical protein